MEARADKFGRQLAPLIIVNCCTFTLDSRFLGFCSSSLFLYTLGHLVYKINPKFTFIRKEDFGPLNKSSGFFLPGFWQKVKISKILESTFLSRLWWSCHLCTFSNHTFPFFLLISVEIPLSQRSVVQEWPVVSLPSSFRLSSGQLSSPDILIFSDEHIVKGSLFSIQFLWRSTLTVLKGKKNA